MKTRAGFRLTVTAAALVLLAILAPTAFAQNVDVGVTKTSPLGTVFSPGDAIQYVITVFNNGPDAAPGVAVTDTFPDQVVVASINVATNGGAQRIQVNGDLTAIDDIVNLPAGSSIVYTVNGQVANEGVTFTVEDILPDTSALLPLNEWAPLCRITMAAPEPPDEGTEVENTVDVTPPQGLTDASQNNDSAVSLVFLNVAGESRRLREFRLHIEVDPTSTDERGYFNAVAPQNEDIYQVGIFWERNVDWDARGTLDEEDHLVRGRSGTLFDGHDLVVNPFGVHFGTGIDIGNDSLTHVLSGVSNPDDPHHFDERGLRLNLSDFQIDSHQGDPPASFIVAIRTSALWKNGQSLAYRVSMPWMELQDGSMPAGLPPYAEDNPDDYGDLWPEPNQAVFNYFAPGTAYSSSFGVWDITSGLLGGNDFPWQDPEMANSWAHPRRFYTPLNEYRRPRFDALSAAFDLVTGEYIELRQLMPLDQWTPVIGMTLHGYGSGRQITNNLGQGFFQYITPPSPPRLKEVNVILTDIGGNPAGPPGNGGFNPVNGLETMTHAVDSTDNANFNPDESIRVDHGFNGIWVFHDTNGNQVFDPPVPLPGGGVSYAGGDYPMFPESSNLPIPTPDERNPGLPRWEHIPNPPGGGDPWWKIRLRFSDFGRRRVVDEELSEDESGYLAPTPDDLGEDTVNRTGFANDFFVVVRPDSGYTDISGHPGDGVGMTMGADFRAFIEPRRFNPNSAFVNAPAGQLDGGIYISTQIPDDGTILDGKYVDSPFTSGPDFAWQEDPLWGVSEPWWPQRTLNPTNTKPVRTGVEIHDLVINYETNNLYAQITDTEYGKRSGFLNGLPVGGGGFGHGSGLPIFSFWLDPFNATASTFADFHSVGVVNWRTWLNSLPAGDDDLFGRMQFPYETVPFLLPEHDLPPFGPRSQFLTTLPAPRTLPRFATWPKLLQPGEYPRESHWASASRTSRYLRQHIDAQGPITAMLGINLVGADDPVVNAISPPSAIKLQQLTVAFWGPDFDPTDLLALDPNGTSTTSGVVLVEDTSGDGVFGAPVTTLDPLTLDSSVRVTNLAWRTAPEFVDLTGDGVADDINGDGIVTDADKAWVLRLRPATPWPLPVRDAPGGNFPATGGGGAGIAAKQAIPDSELDDGSAETKAVPVSSDPGKSYWAKTPVTMTDMDSVAAALNTTKATKAIGPAGNPGDDLFIAVRTSDKLRRFQQFRAFVPSTLPDRAPADRLAGVQLTPQTPISQAIYQKSHPEEGPVQNYYGPVSPSYQPGQWWQSYDFGFDMIEANVAVKLVDLTGNGQTISKNSPPLAVMGLDLSTNRSTAVGTAASGQTGVGGPATFTVAGAGWVPGAFTGFFLIDKNYQPFRITGNNATTLNLQATANAAGTPASGAWRVVRDPSFLEQVILEFYDVGNDGGFNLVDDLLPFDIDPTISGVAIYRDNDNNPDNQNGVFDPGDLPVRLDYAPFQIGQAGEPDTQVMMVFSTPGTDNVPVAIANQARNRQWIPDTFGTSSSDSAFGPDFFIVIRTTANIEVGDNFRVGLVSWGPNTPTEPDPDTFPPPPTSRVGEFDVFAEFPWGARALGFISFFTDQPYYKHYPEVDNSGFDWVRSTANKALQTRTITATEGVVQGDDVAITNVSPSQLPKDVPAGGLTLAITGQNFGNTPIVTLDGVALNVISANNTQIIAIIPGGTTVDPDNNNVATLRVTNSTTGKFAVYSAFTIVPGGGGSTPTITGVNPSSGGQTAFPVTITGTNFDDPKVFFEGTQMPVNSWTPTSIVVGFPSPGGLPLTGPLDVTVQNQSTNLFAVLPNGFNYINNPGGGGGGGGFGLGGGLPTCFIATAAYGSPLAGELDTFRSFRDAVLLKTAVGAAAVDLYYTVSPAIADQVAAHPALAALIRLALTPIAWSLESPALAAGAILLALAGAVTYRRKRRAARTWA